MPTENEKKFLISNKCEKKISRLAVEKYKISQGYLIATRGITVRVRKSATKLKTNYYFTLKVNTNGRCVEIENKIDKRDFEDLWLIALNKLEKIRYEIKHKKEVWECDFFKDYLKNTYISIAEIEMPEGQKEPDSMPDIVKKNLKYKVAQNDDRFSNKLLGDPRYAQDLIKEIKSNTKYLKGN